MRADTGPLIKKTTIARLRFGVFVTIVVLADVILSIKYKLM